MYGIDDKDWLKIYIWGELSWMNMELFEHDGVIWMNDTLDNLLESHFEERIFDLFVPVMYASRRVKLDIEKLPKDFPFIDQLKTKDPSLDVLLESWTYVIENNLNHTELVDTPGRNVSYDVSLKYCIEWMDKHGEDVNRFLEKLKEIIPQNEEEESEELQC